MFHRLRLQHPLSLLLAAFIHLAISSPAAAAAPRIMIAYGPPLVRPVIFSDWNEIGAFIPDETADITLEELAGRPYINFALFWGMDWVRYVDEGHSLGELRPEQANQHARFYPAVGNASPIFWSNSVGSQGPFIHRVDQKGIEILAKHGIPVRLDATTARSNPTTYAIVPDESKASYEVDEKFLELGQLATAIGVTPLVTGEISVDATNPANSRVGRITVNLTLLKSDEPNRDNKLPDYVIVTRRWPVTTFEPTKLEGLPKTYKPGTPLAFKMTGDMTLRDVARPVTFDVTATLTTSVTASQSRLTGVATADIKLSDFGIVAPSLFAGFIRIEDGVKLKLTFVAKPKVEAVVSKVTSCVPTSGRPLPELSEDAPERASVGKGHVLAGVIRSNRGCAPIADVKIVFLLANPKGIYDDDHRATIYTDEKGAYRFESNFPGNYEGSPAPHIHLLISALGHRAIETEYLPKKGQTSGTFDVTLAAER